MTQVFNVVLIVECALRTCFLTNVLLANFCVKSSSIANLAARMPAFASKTDGAKFLSVTPRRQDQKGLRGAETVPESELA